MKCKNKKKRDWRLYLYLIISGPEDEESEEEDAQTEENQPNPLLADLGTTEAHLSKQANLWFKRVSTLNLHVYNPSLTAPWNTTLLIYPYTPQP